MEGDVPEQQDLQRLKLTRVAQARLAEIKGLEPVLEKLSDAELRRKTEELKGRLRTGKVAVLHSTKGASCVPTDWLA